MTSSTRPPGRLPTSGARGSRIRGPWSRPFDPTTPPRRDPVHGRIVVASNRLPVVLKPRRGGGGRRERCGKGPWSVHSASRGLVAALEPVMRRRGGVWVGWSGAAGVGQPELDHAVRPPRGFGSYELRAVELSDELRRRFYDGFSNQVLWPVFHGFAPEGEVRTEDWESYREVNRRFARVLAGTVLPTDHIWVHDYHLMLVASELKALGVDNPISFFLHIPFPRPSALERVPLYGALLRGLLAHDLVGFQLPRDETNFLEAIDAAGDAVGDRGDGGPVPEGPGRAALPTTGAFPISIDCWEFQEGSTVAEVSARAARLRAESAGMQLVLGVDRLDYTKGIPHKLEAFDRALRRFPELRGTVVLRQLVVPSRDRIPAYARLKKEIEDLVARINTRWGDESWRPVDYRYGSWDREELLSQYRAADVALVTPLNDGMNLVAKEYCVGNGGDGVLVLSAYAGAAAELGNSALLVRPTDHDGVARAVRNALRMPADERRARMSAARRLIGSRDVHRWVGDFLGAADRATTAPRPG